MFSPSYCGYTILYWLCPVQVTVVIQNFIISVGFRSLWLVQYFVLVVLGAGYCCLDNSLLIVFRLTVDDAIVYWLCSL